MPRPEKEAENAGTFLLPPVVTHTLPPSGYPLHKQTPGLCSQRNAEVIVAFIYS